MLNFDDSSLGGGYAASPRKYKENTSHTLQERQEGIAEHVLIKLVRFKQFFLPTSKMNFGALPRRSFQLATHISQDSFTFSM